MKYNLKDKNEANLAFNQFNHLLKNERLIEIKEVKKTRSTLQNSALHQFFVLISDELNNLGLEFTYTGIKGLEIGTRYTPDIVKEFVWRPIQLTLFNVKSTTQLDSKKINEIADIIIKFFAEKGIYMSFPSIQSLMDARDYK